MSVPAYPEYKDSGVAWLGVVPRHWEVTCLKLACDVFPSNVDKKSADGEQPVRLCNYTDVYYNDVISVEMPFMKATASDEQIAKFTLRAGDTIITKDSETPDDIARSAYVPDDMPGVVCGYHLSMVRPTARAHGSFIKRYFDTACARAYFHVSANGLTRVGLGQYAVDNAPIALPPIEEQTAISAFLDRETAKIDALVAGQERLIALLKEKRQAVISHAVTKGLNPDSSMKDSGIEWLGEIPPHWEVRRLRFVADIETGDADTANAIQDGEYPFFVRSPNVERINGYTHDCEAVMTAGDGAGVGKVFHYFIGKFRAHQRVYIFRNFRDVTGIWFYEYLKALFYRVVLEGTAKSTVDSLRRPMIANFPMTVPFPEEVPAIEAHISQMSAQFDALISEAQSAIALLHERRAALISAAVTGKIDVRGVVDAAAELEMA